MLDDLEKKYKELEEFAMPYYEHCSTSLSPYKAGFVSGYERCCAIITSDQFRKDLNKALLTVALAAFLGTHLISPLVIPTIAYSLSKIYLLSHSLDYFSKYLAQKAEGIRSSDPDKADSYVLYSGFIKSVSDTILISGLATTLAAPIVGVLSHIQFQLAYNILVPTATAIIRTIGFELSKGKDAAFELEVKGDETSEYLLKAVLIGAGYKMLTSMLGSSLIADLFSFVAARSFTAAFIAAEKNINDVPKHLWEGLNSSVGFCAQYFLFDFSEKLIGVLCESSTALSAVVVRSTSMKLSEEPVAHVKAYYKGIHENIEAYYKDIEPQATAIIAQIYEHVGKITEQTRDKIETSIEPFKEPITHIMAQIKEIDLKAREIIANVYGHASKVTEQSIASTTRQH